MTVKLRVEFRAEGAVQSWDLTSMYVMPHFPEVLASAGEGRAIAIELPAGERLDEHQVHERAWLIVIRGEVQVLEPDGPSVTGREGFFAEFDPNERREVRARSDARLLLILSPWPGEGHPSRRD